MNILNNKEFFSNYYVKYKYLLAKKAYTKNINSYIANNGVDLKSIDKETIRKYKKKWSVLDKNVSERFFIAYSKIYGKVDINYVPDYLYRYPIEKVLMNKRYTIAFGDKNLYEKNFSDDKKYLFPPVILRNIEGVFYDSDYNHVEDFKNYLINQNYKQIVFKDAIDTGSGKGIRLFLKNELSSDYFSTINNKKVSVFDFIKNKKGYLIQKKLEQHPFLNAFNPTSINTIRVVTYRSVITEKVHVMQMLIKRGGIGNFVDNLNSGGSFIEIKKDGSISNFGIDMYGRKIAIEIDNYNLHWYNEIVECAIAIAKDNLYQRQLFFDFFIDADGKLRIMEINYSAHPPIQAVCGSAFSEFTDEVIEYVLKHPGYINIPVKFFWTQNR